MKPTIVITAANGFIGRRLTAYLQEHYHIVGLVRKPLPSTPNVTYCVWDGRTVGKWKEELESAYAVINLAGKSVNCRYTKKNKAAIYASRLESTSAIGEALLACKEPPAVWLNAASATIYAHSLDKPNTETNGVIGTGFSVDVCQQWEKAFAAYASTGVRQIVLRTAIVLGRNGGVMTPFKNLVKWGLGGKMGKGNQQFSWIHEDDLCAAIIHLIEHPASQGVYNLSSPNPVTNAVFMAEMRQQMNKRFGISQPKWMLEAGARIIGTETELIFKSRYVLPERLLQEGFQFRYPTIDTCLKNLLKES